ncbi:MAG: hypothetical protein H6864_04370 [Micavibrio sp.]|jgi:hypothetical protein|nr:hypothetical protein [Micavibrio sp.]
MIDVNRPDPRFKGFRAVRGGIQVLLDGYAVPKEPCKEKSFILQNIKQRLDFGIYRLSFKLF